MLKGRSHEGMDEHVFYFSVTHITYIIEFTKKLIHAVVYIQPYMAYETLL